MACSSLAIIESAREVNSIYCVEGATTENARCCIVEVFTRGLRVFHQTRNQALDGQPGSIQGDRVPIRKLGRCREDSATRTQQQLLCKRCDVEWEANVMCHAYNPI